MPLETYHQTNRQWDPLHYHHVHIKVNLHANQLDCLQEVFLFSGHRRRELTNPRHGHNHTLAHQLILKRAIITICLEALRVFKWTLSLSRFNLYLLLNISYKYKSSLHVNHYQCLKNYFEEYFRFYLQTTMYIDKKEKKGLTKDTTRRLPSLHKWYSCLFHLYTFKTISDNFSRGGLFSFFSYCSS